MYMKEHILVALKEQLNRWEELLADLEDEQITAPQTFGVRGRFEQRHAGHDLRGIILYLVCDDLPETIAVLKWKWETFDANSQMHISVYGR
jgi:hypothetical protein